MSMSLRGWITEDDAAGHARAPTACRRRSRSAASPIPATRPRILTIDADGVAHWKTSVDSGVGAVRHQALQHLWRPAGSASDPMSRRWSPRATRASTCCPAAMPRSASAEPVTDRRAAGPEDGQARLHQGHRLRAVAGLARRRASISSAFAGIVSLLPEGYEENGPKLKDIQDEATAAMVRDVAHKFLTPGQPHADPVRPCPDVRCRSRERSARPGGAGRRRQDRRDRRRRARSRRRRARP